MKIYSGKCFLSDSGEPTNLLCHKGYTLHTGDLVLVMDPRYEYYDDDLLLEDRISARVEVNDFTPLVVLKGRYNTYTDSTIRTLNDSAYWVFGYGIDTDYKDITLIKIKDHSEIGHGEEISNYRFSNE